jgi:DNA-binding response OmpR family regulator
VIQCTDGEQAIREAKERKPDLLILDVFLPALDGFSVLKAIKNHLTRTAGGDDLPVIVITGRGVLMKDMFELEGVREFLQKPFEAAKLVEMVRQHME